MIKEVKLPEVSDNIETGDVVKVLVAVGDTIEIDQPIIELETDKAMFEVPSTEKGIIKEVNVKQGDVIEIGAVIIKVETNGEDTTEKSKSEETDKAEDAKQEPEPEDTDIQEDVNEKDKPEETEKEEETKSKVDTESKQSPKKVSKNKKSEQQKPQDEDSSGKESDKEDEAKQDDKDEPKDKTDEKNLMKVSSEESESVVKSKDKDPGAKKGDEFKEQDNAGSNANTEAGAASPSVRRLARELGVNISRINGTGSGHRITEEDVKSYVCSIISSDFEEDSSPTQKALPDFEKWGEIEKKPMSKVRVITAQAMTYAWTTIPAVTQFDKADISGLEEFRKKYTKKVEDKGGHLTITSILVKICTSALREFERFNSSIDFSKKEVVYKKYFNIGVAVDTDRGLLVPVIKNTDRKNITDISIELSELAEKARNKKITPDEMDGGNFTISNLGGIGGTNFTPIIYSPQVAILGISRADKEAIFINDKFESRLVLPLSLTYDHRIIDGADAARFLRWVCEALENPILINI